MTFRLLALWLLLWLLLLPLPAASAVAQAGRGGGTRAGAARAASPRGDAVRMGVAVQPETVTVGDPFRVVVRVRAPAGSVIDFPLGPDTSKASVEALQAREVTASPDSTVTERSALYRLVAWDTGGQPLALGDVVVRGEVRHALSLADVQVYVRSVLPRDTALQKPKPARDIFGSARPWWPWVLLALLALAALLLLGWWLWRRRRRGEGEEPVDAFARAEREFERIEAMRLLEAGERGRYVALVVDVVRDYLAARMPDAPTSLTSTELVHALRPHPEVAPHRLAPLLAEVDLVKFARAPVTAERARAIAAEARALVRDTEAALTAPRAAAAPVERAA